MGEEEWRSGVWIEWREEGGVRGRVWNGWSVSSMWFENGLLVKNEFGIGGKVLKAFIRVFEKDG